MYCVRVYVCNSVRMYFSNLTAYFTDKLYDCGLILNATTGQLGIISEYHNPTEYLNALNLPMFNTGSVTILVANQSE